MAPEHLSLFQSRLDEVLIDLCEHTTIQYALLSPERNLCSTHVGHAKTSNFQQLKKELCKQMLQNIVHTVHELQKKIIKKSVHTPQKQQLKTSLKNISHVQQGKKNKKATL